MAAIPVSFTGVMWYPDLSVGGGPMPGGGGGGGPPLGFWGGYRPPYVDAGPPGPQPPSGAHPAHPIWRPDLGFWGGYRPPYVDIGGPGPQPHPEHPIVLPPNLPPTMPDPDNRPIEWKTAWSPTTGWVVVGVPTGPTPTPSK